MHQNNYNYDDFESMLNSFRSSLNDSIRAIFEFLQERKTKESASIYINQIKSKIGKEDSVETFYKMLENMPDEVWTIETFPLIEKSIMSIFDDKFIADLKKDMQLEQITFLKGVFTFMINTQNSSFQVMRYQLNRSALKEKIAINVKVGREVVETIDLLIAKSKEFISEMGKNVTLDEFKESMKLFFEPHILLSLRILDILNSHANKKSALPKKLTYLSIERANAEQGS